MNIRLVCLYLFLIYYVPNCLSQSRWTTVFLEGEDALGNCICISYDMGYLLVLKEGHNHVSFCRLIKTDVNGTILWEKLIGDSNSFTTISDISVSDNGVIYLLGFTNRYNNNYDPILIKLNSCGTKEWCTVLNGDANNYTRNLEVLNDNSTISLLSYLNSNITIDRIGIVKTSNEGDFEWIRYLNSSDPRVSNQEATDITKCPNSGFLVSGSCYYKDENPPYYSYLKPYYIKTDSLGNIEWEKIVNNENNDYGGSAWFTAINPDSTYFFSGISHYLHSEGGDAPGLIKMSFSGDTVVVYDLYPASEYGKLTEFSFINDSILIGSAAWGNGISGYARAVKFDSNGSILDSADLVNDQFLGKVARTHDNKILFLVNKVYDPPGIFDAHLFKFNHDLESDSLYTGSFVYDSLCEDSIESDTITINDCNIIVDIEDIEKESPDNKVLVYPNPASNSVTIDFQEIDLKQAEIAICNQYGRVMHRQVVREKIMIVDVSRWSNGVYFIQVTSSNNLLRINKLIIH